MKKWITLLITAILAVCLSSCGGKSVSETPDDVDAGYTERIFSDMDEGEIQESCAITAKITINPKLELLLDERK